MPFVEDFAPFLRDFGTDAVLGGAQVRGIFDNAYEQAFDMVTRMPRFELPTASAGAAAPGTTLVVGAATYRVRNVQPDGTGWTVLLLELST
jgi:hypothetical protein